MPHKRYGKRLIALFSSILLTSCTHNPFVKPPIAHSPEATKIGLSQGATWGVVASAAFASPPAEVIVGGAAIGMALGAWAGRTAHELEILRRDRVQVVQVGQWVRIIIPADKLFLVGSSELEPRAVPILNHVIHFIRRYGEVPIYVYAFSDDVYRYERSLRLTNQQARQVGGYLWARGGHPFYHITAIGLGRKYDVASNGYPVGSAFNRRIEIIMPVLNSQKFRWGLPAREFQAATTLDPDIPVPLETKWLSNSSSR